jgi:hypothetical protein
MNFRFKRKLSSLVISRYNLGLVQILLVFLFFTFLLTIYLYDIIDVNSKNLYIKILSPDIEELGYVDSGVKIYKNDWKLLEQNNQSTANVNNITRMFFKIDRFKLIIKSLIRANDIKLIENLRESQTSEISSNLSETSEENDKHLENLSLINKTISRDFLVKQLKYEKYLLKKRIEQNEIQTIQKLLFEYLSTNDIEKE